MQEVRAAVIGTGVMGRKYAQMIAEGKAGALRLTAVVCRSAGAQQWAKDTLPDTVRVCPSADQLYDYAEEFDAVFVPLFSVFENALKTAPAKYWCWDSVHPTYNGPGLIADAFLKSTAEIFN